MFFCFGYLSGLWLAHLTSASSGRTPIEITPVRQEQTFGPHPRRKSVPTFPQNSQSLHHSRGVRILHIIRQCNVLASRVSQNTRSSSE